MDEVLRQILMGGTGFSIPAGFSQFAGHVDAARARQQQMEQQMIERAKQVADQRARDEAARSPFVRQLLNQATAPVPEFTGQDPSSFAPPTVEDIGTLQGGMPAMPGPVPGGTAFRAAPSSRVDVELGPISFDKGGPAPYDTSGSAFDDAALDAVVGRVNQMQLGQELRRPASRSERKEFAGPVQAPAGPRNAEELELGKKPMEQLVERRKTEESSRRALQVESARGKNKARDTQLVTASKLLMNLRDNQTKMAVAIERAKAVMAKSKKTGQDLKVLKNGWTLARTHADAAKNAVAELYATGAAGAAQDSAEFSQYREAQQEAARSAEVLQRWERAYTDAANALGKGPGVGEPAKGSGAVRMTAPDGKQYDVDAGEAAEAERNGWKRG